MRLKLAHWIFLAMAVGVFAGYLLHAGTSADQAKEVVGYFSLVTEVFLRMIKMIIAPLVFSTLVAGIARTGDSGTVGRIGLKAMAWFIAGSLVSLLLGIIMVNLLQPGASLSLPLPDAATSAQVASKGISLREFVGHLVPRSIFEALSQNEILQIVVFSGFFGVAAAALGEKAAIVVDGIDQVAHIMLRLTGYVMKLAPFAVFAAMTAAVGTQGLSILTTYGHFVGGFYLSMGVLWLVLGVAGFLFIGPKVFRMARLLREPILLAFSTASSEAAYPKTLEALEKLGAPNKIASFVLPLGYSFNLDGSMMYSTFATLFIAQAYGIHLSFQQQLTMLLILMVTSKGMAGVPRASLVVIAATLATFHIPEAGLLLILGVDHFLDMGRSATNVWGNGIATAVVAKSEGYLRESGSEPLVTAGAATPSASGAPGLGTPNA
ncbi:MAG: dicarboxylate/amino acid:cation symporter [Myxococcaceae bacterium]